MHDGILLHVYYALSMCAKNDVILKNHFSHKKTYSYDGYSSIQNLLLWEKPYE